MAAGDISEAFIKQFESEVHLAYQRMGSKLRNTVRSKTGVNGATTTFQKAGTGAASQKGRKANVTPMTIVHSNVECTLADWYAADYVDKLDEIKVNIDERNVITQNAAGALGRKTDEMIVTAMGTTTNKQTEAGTKRLVDSATSFPKITKEYARFGMADIPDDGNRFWAVGPEQWIDLLSITAFSSADYVGMDQLPYKNGMSAKMWMSFMFMQFTGLPVATNITKTYAWHRSAVGHAVGADITAEINYIPEKVSHLATAYMSMGACLIDAAGVSEVGAYAA